MIEQGAAVLVLAIFYGIYFVKLLCQKRRGIRTHQIGTRRERDVRRVERFLSIATLAVVPAQLFSIAWQWSWLHGSARFTGFLLGLLGDAVFFTAVWTMGDSWRAGIPEKDRTAFVSGGIYAYSRNPAFLGFDLMYMGVCLLFCNALTLALSALAMVSLHLQILQEEKYLEHTFGEPYTLYKRQVFRYLGRSGRV